MAFNYATGQYEPDQPAQAQAGPTMNDWMRLAGFNPNMDYAQGQPNPNAPGTNPAGPTGTAAPAPTVAGYPGHNGDPTVTTPYPVGTVVEGTNKPGGVDFSSPTVVPDLMQQHQQSPLQIFSQNAGTTYGNPTLPGDFWSGTAGHYVDPTGNTDATGRILSDAEKTYWQGYDHARASGTLETYLKTVTNPGLAPGTQAQYAQGVQTTTIPGRYLDTTGAAPAVTAPGAPAAANPAAAAQTQYNPLDPAWDYSKPGAVPWQAFVKNLFADANAQQSFKELQGVLTPAQIEQASKLFGWQPLANSANPDANAVYRAGLQAAQADPTKDFSVVKMQDPTTGALSYGLMARAQSTAAQEAGGFYAPGSTNPNSPANIAKAAAAKSAAARPAATTYGKPPVTPAGVTPPYTKEQLLAAETRLGNSQQAAYDARLKQQYSGGGGSGNSGGAQGQLPPGQTNKPYVPVPGATRPQPNPGVEQHNQQPVLDAVARAAAALKAGAAPPSPGRGTPYGLISADGHWRWDGTQWQYAG